MSIELVITSGFGNGTFSGSVGDIATSGYTIGVSLVLQGNKMIAEYSKRNMSVSSIDTTMIAEYIDRKMIV